MRVDLEGTVLIMLLRIILTEALYLVQLGPIIVTLAEVTPPHVVHALKVHIQIIETVLHFVSNAHIA